MFEKGIFGGLFDLNRDGKMDSFERAAEFGMFMQMVEADKNEKLTAAGLDPNELKNMGDFERRQAIANAGLDPYEFE